MIKISLVLWSREIGNTGKFPLKIRITNNGKISYKNLGFSIKKTEWSKANKDVKKTCNQYKAIQKAYEEEEEKMLEDGELNSAKIKLALTKKNSIQEYYQEFLIFKEKYFAYSTYSTNIYVYQFLLKFIENKTVSINRIDRDFITNFHAFLADEEKVGKKYSLNTIHSYFFSFVGFIQWVNKYKKMDIEINFVRKLTETPEKNPEYNTHLDYYKEVIHNVDWAKKISINSYLHMCRYLLSVSLLGMRASDLTLLKISNFKNKVSFTSVCIDEEEDEYEHIKKIDVECTYTMLKNKKTTLSWNLNDSSFKYLVYFLDSDLQIEYADKFGNCIIGTIAGKIKKEDWKNKKIFENLRMIYELNGNNEFKRSYTHNFDLELEQTGALENIDESEKIAFAKELFVRQVRRVEKDKTKDRYLTKLATKRYEKGTEKEKMHMRNNMCARQAESLKYICRKFNIPFFKLHSARHTFAMLIIFAAQELGKPVDLYALKTAMGHKSLSTTEHYLKTLKGEYVSDTVAPALTTL
ncbi:phage integrase SAM-like domain-containing protein [Marinifilum sp. N1E240]|uniref:phage integrase SAM-like domain-containing protein n=1 Tax=Marinifilum sp. N1E240 TaxID=2608082 RepID=UPI00186B7D35|nr:phage integrase SAM-like domain-containing protein [Marinifilum sp. N1E240]